MTSKLLIGILENESLRSGGRLREEVRLYSPRKQQPAYYSFEPGNVHLFYDCKDNGYIYSYGAECDTLNARTNVDTDFTSSLRLAPVLLQSGHHN